MVKATLAEGPGDTAIRLLHAVVSVPLEAFRYAFPEEVIARFANAATPEAAAMDVVPVRPVMGVVHAGSENAAKATVSVAVINAAPYWSMMVTAGCWANAAPAVAVAEGWAVNESDEATEGGLDKTMALLQADARPELVAPR